MGDRNEKEKDARQIKSMRGPNLLLLASHTEEGGQELRNTCVWRRWEQPSLASQ